MPAAPELDPGERYDLHTHSVVSDGTQTPGQLASEVAQLGLRGFALTDHDTAGGWSEARDASGRLGLDFLPGIELTTHTGQRSAHLLAYGPDPAHGPLREQLALLRGSRQERARNIVRRLARDFVLDWDGVLARAGTSVGRPHLADALVEHGYVPTRSEAFASVLHPSGPYYMPIYALDTADAIRIVRGAGGVPVLAHPAANRHRTPFSEEQIRELVGAGLWGIELEHPENTPEWLPALYAIADRAGLVVTGSSDYHGSGKRNRLGERTSSAQTVDAIRAQAAVPR